MTAAFRPADARDADALLALQAAYYAADGYGFDREAARGAWRAILNGEAGRAWIAEADGEPVAYAVLTLGHSLEYQGRDAFVDELYVAEAWRGRGLGTSALELLEAACGDLCVRALHLEVERDKRGAQSLYRRRGFRENDRFLMTKRLPPRGERGRLGRHRRLPWRAFALGAAVGLAVACWATYRDWRLNPAGLFHGPDRTHWSVVWETWISWFVPGAGAATLVALLPAAWRTLRAAARR